MNTIQNRTKVEVVENRQVVSEERTALFGLIKWWVKVSSNKIGNDLFIEKDITIDRIFINGKELRN